MDEHELDTHDLGDDVEAVDADAVAAEVAKQHAVVRFILPVSPAWSPWSCLSAVAIQNISSRCCIDAESGMQAGNATAQAGGAFTMSACWARPAHGAFE